MEENGLKCGLCGEAAQQRCSGCKGVAYCSREHQKKHWKTHKTSCKPPPFEVKQNEELGRYMVASRDLSPDDVIISELPLVAGPKQVSPPLCLGCHAARPRARCPRCLWPMCSETCTHPAAECAALAGSCAPLEFGQELDDPHYAYECITVLRCLLLQCLSPRRWRQVSDMVAHENERKGGEIYQENQVRVVGFLRNFVGLAGWDANRWDVSEPMLHRLCGILDVNALEVRITEATDIQALYATASLLEHSCVPNVRLVFDESMKLTVKAALPIKAGEHIKTTYTHSLWGTQARRQHLQENKYFSCKCERCSDPTEFGTMFSALKCLGDCEDSYLLPIDPLDERSDWICNVCKSMLSSHHVAELVLRLGEEVESSLSRADIGSLELLLTRLEQLTHPQHYHQYAVKHSLVQLLARGTDSSTQAEEQRKREMCEMLLNITRLLDPSTARLAAYEAVLCVELHSVRLQLAKRVEDSGVHLAETKAAKELLERAKHILRFEPAYLPEGKLLGVAKTSLDELDACLLKLEEENK